MNVVGHQHPGPDCDTGRGRMLGQKVPIEAIVVIAEKRPRPPVTALGDVVREARKHSASKVGHEDCSDSDDRVSIKCTVTVISFLALELRGQNCGDSLHITWIWSSDGI